MVSQTVTWTVLPNGVKNGRLQLSVFVSPRLVADSAEATLAPFTDWHDWPRKNVDFYVKVGDAAEVKADPVGPAPRSDLWKKLFTPSTRVFSSGSQVQALQNRVIRSAPTKEVKDLVREEYGALGAWWATSPPTTYTYYPSCCGGTSDGATTDGDGNEDPPPRRPELKLHRVRLTRREKDAIAAAVRHVLERQRFVTGDEYELRGFDREAVKFFLIEQFHNRNKKDNPQPVPPPEPPTLQADDPTAPPRLDFHTAIGSIVEYPPLLRMFGLVRDVSIPLPPASSSVLVSVRPVWDHLPGTVNETPATECAITSSTFLAVASDGSLIKNGLLELDQSVFDVIDIDPDAAATKIVTTAESTYQIRQRRREARDQPAPALESRGLSLTQTNRAQRFDALLNKAATLESSLRSKALADEKLNAEDINRGFRLDVWDDVTKAWHSLCLRKGTYTFAGITLNVDDEGTIVPAHTEEDQDQTIYLHESLARWAGYSLVAPRPGKGTSDDGLVDGDSTPDPSFNLKATFKAMPGTLPKLRYGRSYKFRARTADLAGNGLTLSSAPATTPQVTEPITYRRFEPVPPPYVLLRKRRTEGESHERMVVRSNYDKPITADSQRHLAPQRVAQLVAEQHGMFDVPKGLLNPGGMNRLAYAQIADKDPGTFATTGTPDPSGQDQRFYDVDQLKLPYFPDPLSRGVAFRGLPGLAEDAVLTVDFDYALLQKWPDARPFRIQIVEGSGAPKFDAGKRVLLVQVPKGRSFDVTYGSRINAADRNLLGPWGWLMQWIDDGNVLPPDVTPATLEQWAVEGRLWQLTPTRTLTLVHAVRQPLLVPTFTKPVAVRKVGDTTAKILDKVTLDRPSTIRLDLVASWTEQVDALGEPGPRPVSGLVTAYQVPIELEAEDGNLQVLDKTHEFHDTKYRKVSYELVATTRFAEYFVERKNVALKPAGEATPVSAAGFVAGSDVVTSTGEPRTSYTRGVDYEVDNDTGTITAKGTLTGTVEVAFVAPPITRKSTETKPPAVVDVPSTARPTAPEIAYIVPTFGWSKTGSGNQFTSQRTGNGLRVYLRRPWYSSGDGEQLGVVVPQTQPDPAQLARIERYLTTWGQDPAFRSGAGDPQLQVSPDRTQFPLAIRPRSNLKLAESDRDKSLTDRVAVAPHAVGYDADRRLWYSDITINRSDTAYLPFIRLALARFQPISITGVELSTIVLAQFAQLSPDRTMTAVVDAADPTRVKVTVTGKTYVPVTDRTEPSAMKVHVQTARPGIPGDLAWEAASSVDLSLTATAPISTWSGTVTLPGPRGSRPFRLVVEENERLGNDTSRLVYVDAIHL